MMNEHIFFNVQELHPHTHKFDKHNFDTHNFEPHNFDTNNNNNNNNNIEFDLGNLLIDMNNSPDDALYNDYLDYMNNYTVKNLSNILGYYNINKNKLVKDEMVQIIILFENEPSNKNIVYQRKRLWKNILELKNNEYFKKYILF
jgi:hypothetical protein